MKSNSKSLYSKFSLGSRYLLKVVSNKKTGIFYAQINASEAPKIHFKKVLKVDLSSLTCTADISSDAIGSSSRLPPHCTGTRKSLYSRTSPAIYNLENLINA